jgi:uncharacterized protein (DUF58 family)
VKKFYPKKEKKLVMKLTLNRIIAVAALAMTVAVAIATTAQTQQSTNCATAHVTLSSSALKAGDEMTATVAVENCSAEKESLFVQYSYTDPCGETTEMSKEPLKLKAGEKQDAHLTFLAPSATVCKGNFKVSASILGAGKELTKASAPFSVKAQ